MKGICEMKRVGIITHYYGSKNYGGNLQAYALCKLIQNEEYIVEQISYNMYNQTSNRNRIERLRILKLKELVAKIFCHFRLSICNKIQRMQDHKIRTHFVKRSKALHLFNRNSIPHSERVYNNDNIIDCINDYDVFITGSDQVWNPLWVNAVFFLDFVPSNKFKMSYAASISQNDLTPEQIKIFKQSLSDYDAVSVREENAVRLLQEISPVAVEWVLDPTLLLSSEQWDEICAKQIVFKKYMFCYYLGDNTNQRKIAEQFAKNHGLIIVTLPHLAGQYCKCDAEFGDEQLYDISPEQFISLIKYAEYVFTDSFHATVFSIIYKKQYCVFTKSEQVSMDSRIYSLTSLFDGECHFCDTPEKLNVQYIEGLSDLDYTKPFVKFEEMKLKSIGFLKGNLTKADGKMGNK